MKVPQRGKEAQLQDKVPQKHFCFSGIKIFTQILLMLQFLI